jgi:hypothetical protein
MQLELQRINTIFIPGIIFGRAAPEAKKEFYEASRGAEIKITEPRVITYEDIDKFSQHDRDRLLKNNRVVADDTRQEFQIFSK